MTHKNFEYGGQNGKINWMGINASHVVVLFENGMMEACSLKNTKLEPWRDTFGDIHGAWQVALDKRQSNKSLLTILSENGREIWQVSFTDEEEFVDGEFRNEPYKFKEEIQSFVMAEEAGSEVARASSRRNPRKKRLWVSYKSSCQLALLDLLKKRELVTLYPPSAKHASHMSCFLGMLFCYVEKDSTTAIIAYEYNEVQDLLDNNAFSTENYRYFRVIVRYDSATAARIRPHHINNSVIVFVVGKTLHFLDRAGIMALKKVTRLPE